MLEMKKIGEGRFREVYDGGEKCYKTLKRFVKKEYCDGFTIRYPLKTYTRLKYGILDFNAHELVLYQRLVQSIPQKYMKCIVPLERIEKIDGVNVLVERMIRDEDGAPSRTLSEYGRVHDAEFWDTLNVAYFELEERGFPHFGLSESNVLVQKTLDGVQPVIIDIKRIGLQTFPFQPLLCFREQRLRKTLRAWKKIFDVYGV